VIWIFSIRGCIQKFSDWVGNEIYAFLWYYSLRSNTKKVMAAELTRVTHKIVIHLYLVAESCTICSSRSRRPVWKPLDTPSYRPALNKTIITIETFWPNFSDLYREEVVLGTFALSQAYHYATFFIRQTKKNICRNAARHSMVSIPDRVLATRCCNFSAWQLATVTTRPSKSLL
jgi:hypothetical protein